MKPVVVVGYASVDYVATVNGDIRWGWTSQIASRPLEGWPRPGGCPYYVARALARGDIPADVVTWTGDDASGHRYAASCRDEHVGTQGISAQPGARTLSTVLLYNQAGECACLVDFGSADAVVTPAQEGLIRDADTVVVTVAPAACSLRVLDLVRTDATVVWVAKNDPLSFPPELRVRLGHRATYIFCNDEERAWINEATAGADRAQVIIETRGAKPIVVSADGGSIEVPVEPLRVGDVTGAGDTLAGATLAAILGGEQESATAVSAGARAAHELLEGRTAALIMSGDSES